MTKALSEKKDFVPHLTHEKRGSKMFFTEKATLTDELDLTPEGVLPHEHPMILLDEIAGYGELYTEALFTPSVGKPFADDSGCVPIWVGMEYMAQTIGAYAGIQARLAGEPVKIGFLLGTRAYDCSLERFCSGTVYRVRVEKVYEGDGLSSFDCSICSAIDQLSRASESERLARATINTFQPDDIQAFMAARQGEKKGE